MGVHSHEFSRETLPEQYMKLFISIFIVASLVFVYTLFNTGFSRRLKPNGGYNEGFQNSCSSGKKLDKYLALWIFLVFMLALFLSFSLEYYKK